MHWTDTILRSSEITLIIWPKTDMKKHKCTMKKILEHEKSWRKSQKLRTKLMNIDSNMEKKKDMKKCHESTSTHIIKHIHNINTSITHVVMDISIYFFVYVCINFFVRFTLCLNVADFFSLICFPNLLNMFWHSWNTSRYEFRIQV